MRVCNKCGRELPDSEYYATKPYRCKDCIKADNKVWRDTHPVQARSIKERYNYKMRGHYSKPRQRPQEVPVAVNPIPALEIGRTYHIIDTGRTWQGVAGGDGNAKPIVYRGPCIARWGVNWGIKTTTGIRCFTPGTLVGLQVQEVA